MKLAMKSVRVFLMAAMILAVFEPCLGMPINLQRKRDAGKLTHSLDMITSVQSSTKSVKHYP